MERRGPGRLALWKANRGIKAVCRPAARIDVYHNPLLRR